MRTHFSGTTKSKKFNYAWGFIGKPTAIKCHQLLSKLKVLNQLLQKLTIINSKSRFDQLAPP